MFRSLLVAASVALSVFAMPPEAEAHKRSGVSIHFGVPFYHYRGGPGWRYRPGYGWYDHRRYGNRFHHRLSCREARRLVDRRYDRVRVRDCRGRIYTFRAETRRGNRVTVHVNSRTGAMWRR